jgi:O-antigen ligase
VNNKVSFPSAASPLANPDKPNPFFGSQHSGHAYNKVIGWGIFLQIYLAPLPLASNQPIFWFFWAALNGLLLSVWSFGVLRRKIIPRARLRHVWFLALVFATLIIWPLLQTQIDREIPHPWWYTLSAALNSEALLQKISTTPQESIRASIRYASYAIVFWLTLQITSARSAYAERFFRHVLYSALIYAIYSLVTYGLSSEKLFFYPHENYSPSVSGTYLNRNHYATHVGMAIILTLGILFQALRREVLKNGKNRIPLPALIKKILTRTSYYIIALAILMAVLLLSFSRAGLVTTVIGILIFLLPISFLKDLRPIRNYLLFFNGLIVLIVFSLIQIGGHSTFARMLDTESDLISRNLFYKTTLLAIEDGNAIMGTGAGSFEHVYSRYKTAEDTIFFRIDHAHNTYIENVLELGWPAYGIVLSGILIFAGYALYIATTRNNKRIYGIMALAIMAQTGLHAMLDYSYEIYAFTMTISVVLGALMSEFINRKTR